MNRTSTFATRATAACLLTVAALSAGPAFAQLRTVSPDGDQPVDSGSRWGLGFGIGQTRKAYTGIESKTEALPLVLFENRYVRVFGPAVDLKLPPAGPVDFSLRVRYSGDGYEASDAPILGDMATRKAGVWLGGTATWRAPLADLSAEWLGSVSASKGMQFKLRLEREFDAGRFSFSPRVSATWYDSRYVDYYYGVEAGEARVGRAAYEGSATVNTEIALRTAYKLAPRQLLLLDLGVTHLGKGIQDSPLVDRSRQTEARIGYVYRF